MLTFTLNNRAFLLNTETSVRLTWVNPACNTTEFPGDIGMGIEIPANDHNRALLGYPERFEKLRTGTDYEFPDFEIRYSGYLLMRGTFVVQSANLTSYSGWLRSTVGNFGKEHREKYIADIPAFIVEKSFVNKANYDVDNDPYGCPLIYNPEFFYEKSRKVTVTRKAANPNYVDLSWWEDLWNKQQQPYIDEPFETEELTEAFLQSASHFINDQNPDFTIKTPSSSCIAGKIHLQPLDTHVVSPMLFLNYVLKQLFLDAGLVLNSNFLATHTDFKKLIIYNNYDITNMYFNTEGEVVSGNFSDGDFVKYYSYKIGQIFRDYEKTFQFKNLLPKIQLKDFLLSIQNLLNVFFHFRSDGKVDIIDRESIFSNPAIDISSYMVNQWELEISKSVALKFSFEHDANDMFFQERWEDIDDLRELEGDPVDTWADLDTIVSPEIGEVRYIISDNIYVRYDYIQSEEENPDTGNPLQTDALGWQHLSIGFQNGYYNRGKEEEEEIKTKFSTLIGDQTVSVQQPGNIQSMKFAYQNFSPRLLFYLGNNRAKFETANISLDWEKSNTGLFATRWKKWAQFWSQRQPVTREADLPLNVLDYMIRNIYSNYRSREGEFIIESIETEFSTNRIGVSTIKGYKNHFIPQTFSETGHWSRENLILDPTL